MDQRIATSLDELGTEDRAIVELAEVRGIGDAEIAGYLGVDAHEAKRRRRAALGRLADRLGVSREEARAALTSALPPGETNRARRRNGRAGRPVDHVADRARAARRRSRQTVEEGGRTPLRPRASAPVAPPPQEPKPTKRRRTRHMAALALVFGLLAAGIVGAVLQAQEGPDPQPRRAAGVAAGSAQAPPVVQLAPLAGTSGTVEARLSADGRRLTVTAAQLPDPGEGRYAVWLYGSLTRTRLLGSAADGDFEVQTALPRERSGYRLIDVSLEPVDRVRGHSGQSLLRVPLADLQPEG